MDYGIVITDFGKAAEIGHDAEMDGHDGAEYTMVLKFLKYWFRTFEAYLAASACSLDLTGWVLEAGPLRTSARR